MLRKLLFMLLVLILSSLAVVAQEDLPADANACNEGGSMAGKCNVDFNEDGEVSDFEVAWAWTCGWYMIRYDAGIFVEVPSFCQSLLPSEPVVEIIAEEGGFTGFCYTPGEGDIPFFIWPANPDGTIQGESKPVPSDITGGNPPCVVEGPPA